MRTRQLVAARVGAGCVSAMAVGCIVCTAHASTAAGSGAVWLLGALACTVMGAIVAVCSAVALASPTPLRVIQGTRSRGRHR